MKHIAAPTIGCAWMAAYRLVMKDGHIMNDGTVPIKEVMNLYVTVENAQISDSILDGLADSEMIDWMVNKNFGGTEPISDWGYCYGVRLRDFKGKNQIAGVVSKLKKRPGSKASTITLIDPATDFDGHMPCIVAIDCKIRDGSLTLTGLFRSQDIGKKFYADMLAIAAVQKEIADEVGVACGSVELLITSAHVCEPDWGLYSEGTFAKFAECQNPQHTQPSQKHSHNP